MLESEIRYSVKEIILNFKKLRNQEIKPKPLEMIILKKALLINLYNSLRHHFVITILWMEKVQKKYSLKLNYDISLCKMFISFSENCC